MNLSEHLCIRKNVYFLSHSFAVTVTYNFFGLSLTSSFVKYIFKIFRIISNTSEFNEMTNSKVAQHILNFLTKSVRIWEGAETLREIIFVLFSGTNFLDLMTVFSVLIVVLKTLRNYLEWFHLKLREIFETFLKFLMKTLSKSAVVKISTKISFE